jgi:hypothetical protein
MAFEFERGDAFTWLPANVLEEEAYQFSSGGKLKPDRLETIRPGDGTVWTKIPDTSSELASHLARFLKRSGAVALFENRLLRPTDPGVDQLSSRVLPLNGEAYHVLYSTDANDAGKIRSTIREATNVGTVIAMAVTGGVQSIVRLDEEIMRQIIGGIEQVIVLAYDFEGYLIWVRRGAKSAQLLKSPST